MAVNGKGKTYSFMEFPLSISRQDAFPLDKSSVFYSLAEAQEYAASSPLAYVGQYISVVTEGTSMAYQVKDAAGTLEALGAEGVSIATDAEVEEMLDEIFGAVPEE